MPIPTLAAADFLAALQRMLPSGRIWPRLPQAAQSQALAALMPMWERLAAADKALVVDAFPATAVYLLPEWEAALGLPDPCLGPSPTIAQRQGQVVARLTAQGGASIAQFTAFAALLGYPITVREYAPMRFARNSFGQPMFGPAWAYAWNVICPAAAVPILACEFGRTKPAHTSLLFNATI